MSRKRKASDGATVAAVAGPDGGAAPAAAKDNEMNEIEQQLCAHAAAAYNDFVRFFQRRTSELLAANRMMIVRHQQAAARTRQSYPVAATLPHHHALMNVDIAETSEPLLPPHPNVQHMQLTTISSAGESVAVRRRAVVLPRVPLTPNSTMWTALSKNFEAEDQPQLKYLLYFGDDDDDDVVSEFYQIKLQGTSTIEVEFAKELCASVLQQLHATWQLSASDLRRVAQTIDVEPEVVSEIHKQLRAAAKRHKRLKRSTTTTTTNDRIAAHQKDDDDNDDDATATLGTSFAHYEAAVDSFRSLFCRRCYVYDCDYHGCAETPKLEITEQNAVAEKIKRKTTTASNGRNCGNQCFLGRVGSSSLSLSTTSQHFSKARAIATAFAWDKHQRLACVRAYFLCNGNVCDIARLMGDKTCLEVAEFCDANDVNELSLSEERKLKKYAPRRGGKKKKMSPSISHLQHTLSRLVDGVPTKIEPCAHAGPCDSSCSCIVDGVFCSKLCNCVHSTCPIFYHGCKCNKGRCRTKACPCFAAGRECDLDQCVLCCAEEITTLSIASTPVASTPSCQNRNLTLGRTKHLRVARSTMGRDAGWGLFVGEHIAKDEFLIEYIGELVTHEEAERRGAVYDKLNRSYLFNLDSGSVVDSTRKGNKTRFINHDSVRPNCYAKIVFVNSDYRIGMYAMRDLEPHTELFFDYRYDQEFHNVNLHKQPNVTEWMKDTTTTTTTTAARGGTTAGATSSASAKKELKELKLLRKPVAF